MTQPLTTANSLSTNFNQINNVIQQLNNEQTIKVIKDSTGTPRVLIGNNNTFSGLKTSIPGVDVTTATNAQLSFSSDSSFTILKSGTFTFPPATLINGATSYATSQVIAHGATFTPAMSCFAPLQVGNASLPVYPPDFPTTLSTFMTNGGFIYQLGLAYMVVYYGANATNFYLGMAYINDSGGTLTLLGAPVTYYVYAYHGAAS